MTPLEWIQKTRMKYDGENDQEKIGIIDLTPKFALKLDFKKQFKNIKNIGKMLHDT